MHFYDDNIYIITIATILPAQINSLEHTHIAETVTTCQNSVTVSDRSSAAPSCPHFSQPLTTAVPLSVSLLASVFKRTCVLFFLLCLPSFHIAEGCQRGCGLEHASALHSFLWVSDSTVLCITTFALSINLLMDIWVFTTYWLLGIVLL